MRRLRRALRLRCHRASTAPMRITRLDPFGAPLAESVQVNYIVGYCTRRRWHRGLHNAARNLGGPL